jgi:hypothetical protein
LSAAAAKLDLIEAENFAVYYGIGLRVLETWEKQSDKENSKRMMRGDSENDRILKKEELLSPEEESREKRKLSQLGKPAARTSLGRRLRITDPLIRPGLSSRQPYHLYMHHHCCPVVEFRYRRNCL